MTDELSALFAEPKDVPAASDPHEDPTQPEPAAPEPAEPDAEPREPDAEPREGDGEDGELVADRQGNISFQALQRERDKRREIQAKLDAQAAMIQRIEGRFQQLHQQQQPQQPPQRPPTVDEDPIEVLRQVDHERQQRAAWEQQQSQRGQFESHVAQLEQQYMRQQPDYAEAAAFLQQRRSADLEAMGVTSPQQRAQVLYQEAAGMASNAIQAGKNPAEVAYNLARSWGYQPGGQQQNGQQQNSPPRGPNGQFTAEQKLDMAERGQQASRSLSAGGGRAPAGMTLESLATMSDEDFFKVAHDEAKWRKVWGADQ